MEHEIETLLQRADHADRAAADALFVLLYHELHRLAEANLRRAGSMLTLRDVPRRARKVLSWSGADLT